MTTTCDPSLADYVNILEARVSMVTLSGVGEAAGAQDQVVEERAGRRVLLGIYSRILSDI
jgi:hypothetical protein